MINRGLSKSFDNQVKKLNFITKDTTQYDILMLGSSRMETGVNPIIIDTILMANSYNLGIGGGTLIEFNYLYKAYLEHHKPPKCLIIGVDKHSFDMYRGVVNHFIYYNYLNSKSIKQMLVDNNKQVYSKTWVYLTEIDDYYKGQAFKGLIGNLASTTNDVQIKGYAQNTNLSGFSLQDSVIKYNPKIEKRGVQLLLEIIEIAKQNRTKVLLLYLPELPRISAAGYTPFYDTLNQISRNNDITFLRHDTISISKDKIFFKDFGHLNYKGSLYYSQYLANSLYDIANKKHE
ncbi:MAG: hypothetical protein KA101_00275 [Saprospiraceae bacterium]|nr:hypothetical protein [Saprospiraceae bacterium]